ncbi:MAG: GTPase [Nanoarchaeota archaeon]|nr:50S ribosome-binding GTPase [Nanoarchaeota archaeon]MBU1030893.1 50S ribosome-binding GTPase [Nanoarchaeota archaeon]MBU1849455.1 50S ribosome-binding GTPase [Nanoarchaeota archaeon]
MANFWHIVNNVIRDADVLLLLLDARLVNETRNLEIEKKVKAAGKPLIYVITKCDLVENKDFEDAHKEVLFDAPKKKLLVEYKKELKPCVFVSAIKYYGVTILRERILIEANKHKIKSSPIKVGVLGYPNVGKSSLINAVSGGSGAPTSMMSGYTKGLQKIKCDNRIMFLDTPGVIPFMEKESEKHSMIGSVDFTKVKEPDLAVMKIMEQFPGKVEAYYDVPVIDDFEATLENITISKNIIKSGNQPNIDKMARTILKNWQKGNIK